MSVTLYDLIAWVETKQDARAIRFEPATYERITNMIVRGQTIPTLARVMAANPGISHATSRMLYATSFGTCQLMGFNLYSDAMRYGKSIVEYLTSEQDQRLMFEKFVAALPVKVGPAALALSRATREKFGHVYNGDGPAYAAQLVLALKHYGFAIRD